MLYYNSGMSEDKASGDKKNKHRGDKPKTDQNERAPFYCNGT